MRAFLKVRTLLFVFLLSVVPAVSHAGVFLSIDIAPPVLPVYAQPVCPGDGYLWTPGYWAYAPTGYYWMPGVWVMPPQSGLLWTPGYWAFTGGFYRWNAGYWGPRVGFYGGVNYGYGYPGAGFIGGRWSGGHFFYNSAVSHVDAARVRNVYVDRTVIRNNSYVSRASFNRSNFAAENHGRPATPAMSRPAQGTGRSDYNARPTNNNYRGGADGGLTGSGARDRR